jgi:SAM-dependent methyltransferase
MAADYESIERVTRYVEAEWGDFIPDRTKSDSSALLPFGARTLPFYKRIREIVRDVRKTAPKRIFDAGAGTGRTAYELCLEFPDAEFVAGEKSGEFVRLARSILLGEDRPPFLPINGSSDRKVTYVPFPSALQEVANQISERSAALTYIETAAEDLRYPDGYFDLVLALNVVDRVPDPGAFIEGVARYVAKGGVFILATPYDWDSSSAPKEKHIHSLADAVPAGFKFRSSEHVAYNFRRDCYSEINYRTEVVVFERK